MNKNKKEIFTLDRRKLLKSSLIGITAASIVSLDEVFAAGDCDMIQDSGVIPSTAVDKTSSAELFYWIDGFYASMPNIKPRISVHVNLMQSESSFVESVILGRKTSDTQMQVLSERRFTYHDKTSNGKVPYVVFDNVPLDNTYNHVIMYSVRSGTVSKVYFYTIDKSNIRLSRYDYTHLSGAARKIIAPATFINGFVSNSNYQVASGSYAGGGYANGTYQYFTHVPRTDHNCYAQIKALNPSTGDFKIDIRPMHADVGPGHWMRYFVAFDPVGRILGATKRFEVGDSNYKALSMSGGKPTPITIEKAYKEDVISSDFNGKEQANIIDCPFVQCMTDDVFHAISRTTLRLR